MRNTFLSFSPPSIGDEERANVLETLNSDWLTTGPRVKQFEKAFADFVGVPAAAAFNSWTSSAHAGLVALGLKPGDEVITTPMTFCASVNIIEHVGARPVLVDVEADTLNLDPARVAAAITPRTRAILPVHYAGHPVDLDPINDLARRAGATVLEDAAHAFPARYKGRLIGTGDNLVAYSFYVTKNMTTIEGGMLVGPGEILDRARILGLHGMSRDAWKRYDKGGSWKYDVVAPGFKYNMTDIQAVIGLAQLPKLADFQARRRAIVERYHRAFRAQAALELPVERADVEHSWHLYVLRLRPGILTIDRDRFIAEMTARNIGTSVHFIPIHMHSYYREKYGYRPDDFPVTLSNYERMLSIPLHPRMSDQDVDDVIAAVDDIITTFKR